MTGLAILSLCALLWASPTILDTACPDVVFLDSEMPGLPMPDLLAKLLAHGSSPKVFVLCYRTEKGQAALAAGVHASIDKTAHPRRLLIALRVLQLESEYEQ